MAKKRAEQILLLALAISAAPAARAQGAVKPATFRTEAQLVLIPVTVTDHNGKTVEGLRAEDFSVFDDQKPQQIVSFAREDAPSSVGLVLDTSGSMQRALGGAKEMAGTFLGTANSEDEFLLLTVSTQPASTPGFTTDAKILEKEIGSASPGGMTALIDTVYYGLSRMREARRPRRALLILSDGMDNYSRYSQSELMRVAIEADVQVYTIIVDGLEGGGSSSGGALFRPRLAAKPWDRGPEALGPEMLEKLSEKTGGIHIRVHGAAAAKTAVANVGDAIRYQYLIGYQPPDSGQPGKWHRVRIKPNVQRVNIYSRGGYYAR